MFAAEKEVSLPKYYHRLKSFFVCFFLQREPPQCPPRPASYTPSSNNEPVAYSNTAAVALNNLDTLRSYGSAGDELEIIPPDYLRNLNRRTPVPPPSLGHSIPVGGNNAGGSDNDSLHKPSWQEQMQLASFISDAAKIKNGESYHIPDGSPIPQLYSSVASYFIIFACGMKFF